MSNIAIKVENLSKAYQLGQIGTGTISRDFERWYARIRGKDDPFLTIGENNNQNTKSESNIVWSLRDINFEIKEGDAVGIIGRNGAGKSTLLKILSRVTAPTTGKISGRGRIASLLEVGTGFHPELSGRENIFLNGAILGMRKKEIQQKLEEIVDFAGIERYLDTPVKRYSSGMYVRLAFAVAAHLESEILIVDEVLAVGDAEFQKKCLGKMDEVSKGEGRTVLFVSHNMSSINQLCKRAILLNNGNVFDFDTVAKVIPQYFNLNNNNTSFVDLKDASRKGNSSHRFDWVELKNNHSKRNRDFNIGDEVVISFQLTRKTSNLSPIRMSVELKSSDGLNIANLIDEDSDFDSNYQKTAIFSLSLKDVRFYPDTYILSLYVGDTTSNDIFDYVEDCISFEIIGGGKLTTRPLPRSAGLLFLTPEWKSNEIIKENL